MQYLPLFVKLTDKAVLIVGGGSVALRKAGTLLSAGAKLTVVAPEFADEFVQWQREGKAELINGYFAPELLDGKLLVIAATDNDAVNAAVYDAASARNMLVNTVDDQPKCGFIFPSIIDRSPILIAISSFGTAPVLARRAARCRSRGACRGRSGSLRSGRRRRFGWHAGDQRHRDLQQRCQGRAVLPADPL